MEHKRYLELIGRYLSGDISTKDKDQLMQWVANADENHQFFEEMNTLWSASDSYEEPTIPVNTASAWTSLEQKIDQIEGNHSQGTSIQREAKVRKLYPGRLLRYAAAILLLVSVGYWAFINWNPPVPHLAVYSTITGQQETIVLPDSSIVILNELSTLAYNLPFEERNVQLTGEAFFEVTKQNGKTFTIEAEGTTTTVLGTSFNVRAYPEEEKVEVSVASGKVAVNKQKDEQKKVELIAGQATVYDKSVGILNKTIISNANAWQTKQLNFDNEKLGDVITNLERYFNVPVRLSDEQLKDCRYLGSFTNPSLEEVLTALEFTMDLQVDRSNGAYLISGDASQCQ